jgi:glycosyltransferase involved in cell wall biosynthesis
MDHIRIGEQTGTQKMKAPPGIPTQDPQEALRFCRWLENMLRNPLLASDDGRYFEKSSSAAYSELGAWPRLVKPTLSVVIPVYEEEANLPVLYGRLVAVLEEIEPDFELIFVDDGSRDRSCEVMSSLSEQDERLTVIELARNFGHQVAISAGLDYARGDAVIIMDADLQDPPEVLPEFIEKWREGHEVVYAIRAHRQEGPFKRLAYTTFYRVLQRIANIDIPLDAGDFCIMDRRVVNILVNMPERNRFVRGIRSWIGLDQVGLVYERQARRSGRPKFTFTRLLYLALDGLVSFSYIPLRAISILGFSVSLISILLAVFYAIKRITSGLNPPGFATTIVAILFLAGMQLITMGVIGEYVGRIFEEVKRRPLYVVRQVVRRQD